MHSAGLGGAAVNPRERGWNHRTHEIDPSGVATVFQSPNCLDHLQTTTVTRDPADEDEHLGGRWRRAQGAGEFIENGKVLHARCGMETGGRCNWSPDHGRADEP